MIRQTLSFLAPLALAIAVVGCIPDPDQAEIEGERKPAPIPADQLAALGELAKSNNPQIRIEGGITGSEVSFTADYAPLKKTLSYKLSTPKQTEFIVVSPDTAVRSTGKGADQTVNRESFMPNGKDWPYGSRMVAPFLDAIDGYTATIHSFHIANSQAPADIENADQLKWFALTLNRDQAHDLLLLEFSKVSDLRIGIDPNTGLLKSLYSIPKKGEQTPTEIRSK